MKLKIAKLLLILCIYVLHTFSYAISYNVNANQSRCTYVQVNQPTEWENHYIPIPVAIDSRMGNTKVELYINALSIWNKIYRSYIRRELKPSKKYPDKLFSYLIVTSGYSDYESSTKIIWISEKILSNNKNGETRFLDHWLTGDIKGAYISLNRSRLIQERWYFATEGILNLNWNKAKQVTYTHKVDYLTVAMHELGHAIGLEHTTNQQDVMFPCTYHGYRVFPTFKNIEKFLNIHSDIQLNLLPYMMGMEL